MKTEPRKSPIERMTIQVKGIKYLPGTEVKLLFRCLFFTSQDVRALPAIVGGFICRTRYVDDVQAWVVHDGIKNTVLPGNRD